MTPGVTLTNKLCIQPDELATRKTSGFLGTIGGTFLGDSFSTSPALLAGTSGFLDKGNGGAFFTVSAPTELPLPPCGATTAGVVTLVGKGGAFRGTTTKSPVDEGVRIGEDGEAG
jgi:hypothetical protein